MVQKIPEVINNKNIGHIPTEELSSYLSFPVMKANYRGFH